MKFNIDVKKILHTSGKKDEENAPLPEQLYSLGFRKLADIGVRVLGDSKITPNQITIARAVGFLPLIFFLFSRGTYVGNVLGVLCCALNSLFDILDGNLARAKSLTSEIGAWLDHTLDKLAVYIVLAGVVLGSYRLTQNYIFLVAGVFVLFLHGMIVNVSNDYDSILGEDFLFDAPLKEAVDHNKKSTFFDKIFVNMFVFNSFWSYFFFAVRYPVLIGAAFNVMPYAVFYLGFAFALRWIFLCLVYLSVLGKGESRCVFINELKKKLEPKITP